MPARSIKVWNSTTNAWEDVAVAAPDTSSLIANALISGSKGALITSTGSAVDDLTVGADGTVLTADSGEALGIKWAAPSSGGLISETTFTASGTYTIPAGATLLEITLIGAGAGGSGGRTGASVYNGGGPGGGGGGGVILWQGVNGLTSLSVSVGAGGTGGAPGTAGAVGGATAVEPLAVVGAGGVPQAPTGSTSTTGALRNGGSGGFGQEQGPLERRTAGDCGG